jgi:hypothetical protein
VQCDSQRTYDAEVICLEIPAVEVCALAVAVKVWRLDPAELVVAAFAGFEICEALVQFDLQRTYDTEVICLGIPTVEVCALAVYAWLSLITGVAAWLSLRPMTRVTWPCSPQ